MNKFGKEQIVPKMHRLPLVVLGTGMLSVILAGFAGSKLPSIPAGAGINKIETLEDLGLVRDDLMVSEVTTLPTADLIVAAEAIVNAGQLFEPVLVGDPQIDGLKDRVHISVPADVGELGPWAPVKSMSIDFAGFRRNAARRSASWRDFSYPRFSMPRIRRIGRGDGVNLAITEPVLGNEHRSATQPVIVEYEGANDVGHGSAPSAQKQLASLVVEPDLNEIAESGDGGNAVQYAATESDPNPAQELFRIQDSNGSAQPGSPAALLEPAAIAAPGSLLLTSFGLFMVGAFRSTRK